MMHAAYYTFYNTVRRWLRSSPGLVLLFVVLVLLYDVGGAMQVLGEMMMTLLATLVGGGDHQAVSGVLWRTLPLALAAVGVAYAACSGWLELDCLHSYVWMAFIVMAGAIVGNACHELQTSRPATSVSHPTDSAAGNSSLHASTSSESSGDVPGSRSVGPRAGVEVAPPPATAWQRLSAIRWLQKPDLNRRPRPVEPLRLLPEGSGIFGVVGGAMNQLLGYLVEYEPRLFLASLLAGGFAGWRLHGQVAFAHAAVAGQVADAPRPDVQQKAA